VVCAAKSVVTFRCNVS